MNFAQLRSEPEDPNLNLTAVGMDFFQFWYDNFNDFDPLAAIYSGWAERFSVDAEFGITIEKNINGSWIEVVNVKKANVGYPSYGSRWYYDGTIYLAKDVAPFGNGTYRGKGWVHAWNMDKYAESAWDAFTVNDVIAPQTPGVFSANWSSGHPMLTIDDNEELDFKEYRIYKKVDNGTWTYKSSITGNIFIDYGEIQYHLGSKIKRNVYYKSTATDYVGNESLETSSLKFVCNDQANKNNLGENSGKDLATSFKLEQNYPNPFNPSTEIKYSVPNKSFINLSVYNLLGQKVKTLIAETKETGHYSINFDATGLSAGTYIYRMTTGKYSVSKKMILMK